MTRPTIAWRSVAVVGIAALALAACGGSDTAGDETTPTSSAAPSQTPSATTPVSTAEGDGVLKLGTLLPQTGSLAFLGPPEFAGVDAAIADVNAAGGVLGKPVEKTDSDSGDTKTNIASQSVDKLLGVGVDAIVGAASSGVTLTVIDKITGAGVVQFSPANTSPTLSDYPDKGLFFRTAPSDVLQGRVLGDLMLEDGNATVGIMALQDPYGTGLAESVTKSVTDGGGEVVETVVYDPTAASFSAEVSKIVAAAPDAIALIAFDETKKIIPEMVKQGVDISKVYFVDGNMAQYGTEFPNGTLEGAKGTLPGVKATEEFQKKLIAVSPGLKDFAYAPESYDAVVLIALAAEAAKSDAGTAIGGALVDVSKGGEKCTDFAACKALLAEGKDIDYDGVSGPVEFADNGDPSEATIGIYQFGADNNYTFLEGKAGKV